MTADEADTGIALFIEALSRDTRVSLDGPYTPLDRYRDFRAVFSTDQGQRVFKQIIDLCDGFVPREDDPPAVLAGYVARRRLGLKLSAILAIPPKQQT